MRYSCLWVSIVCALATSSALATENKTAEDTSRFETLQQLKKLRAEQFKVDANAAQSEEIKDPLQPLNRQIYAFNDALDRTVLRPVAVTYSEKIPEQVRGSLTQARKNLDEPWNAVNQLAQGKPLRAAKSLGRFTINTLTTLGFADPAQRLGLDSEDESLGTTLGFYGVPSGPYFVMPLLGPSTIRDGLGSLVDTQARPQKYILDDNEGLYWTEMAWRGVDARAGLLDLESVLQGDKYSAMRDIYLQRKSFEIAQKRGLNDDSMLFIDDDFDDSIDLDQENLDSDQ
ncbi:VacJ family lipoprotein [Acinetobacter sp.]|uniref:MlaA family lipoprotein n=1 Tax=Acinetobacter sp. TaxID=472 RepID=UPI003890D262